MPKFGGNTKRTFIVSEMLFSRSSPAPFSVFEAALLRQSGVGFMPADGEDVMEIAEEIFFDLAMVDGAGEGASYLTREELVEATGGHGDLFDELDTDKSGAVQLEEWLAYFERKRAERGEEWVTILLVTMQDSLVDEFVCGLNPDALTKIEMVLAWLWRGENAVVLRQWRANQFSGKEKDQKRAKICQKAELVFELLSGQSGTDFVSKAELIDQCSIAVDGQKLLEGFSGGTAKDWRLYVEKVFIAKHKSNANGAVEWLQTVVIMLQKGLVSQPLSFEAPDEDGNIAVPPFTWFEVVGNPTGAGSVLREGAELDSALAGEVEVGLCCRVELMHEVDAPDEDGGKKMQSKIVEPVVGWMSSSYLRCISGGCGFCEHCQTKKAQEDDKAEKVQDSAAVTGFDAIDRNRDGVIDRGEYEQAQELRRQADTIEAEKLVNMTDEERALHLQKELNDLEEKLAEAKESRLREKKRADAQHTEWERRLRDAERGVDGKLEMQNRLTQMEFELETERAKSKAREVLKAQREKERVKTDKELREALTNKVRTAVKTITAGPSDATAGAPKRGYAFNSFQSDVHNMMQALGRRDYLEKYAGKKVEWGSKPLNLSVNPPTRNEEVYTQWKAKKQWDDERRIWDEAREQPPTAAASGQGQAAAPGSEKRVRWGANEPAPPPDNKWVDDILSTQATVLKARGMAREKKRRSAKRFGVGALLNQPS